MNRNRVAMTLEQAANALATTVKKPSPTCPKCGPIRWAKCEFCGVQNAVFHEEDPVTAREGDKEHYNFCKQCGLERDKMVEHLQEEESDIAQDMKNV